MTLYQFAVVAHVFGAVGLFLAVGIEAAGLFCLFRATTNAEIRTGLAALGLNRFIGPPSILATLVTGVYGAHTWGWPPWIAASLALLMAVVLVGAVITGRATATLERRLMAYAVNVELPIRARLAGSFTARGTLLVAILVLMLTKPGLSASCTIGGTAALAAMLALSSSFRPQANGART